MFLFVRGEQGERGIVSLDRGMNKRKAAQEIFLIRARNANVYRIALCIITFTL